ncbi:Ca(2+)-dependent cysteine protease [Perkinsus olseni]|uniref:Ca(2+)-dependent cysteine protease n=1 Tax=Perkinsus olseni TaxID=32597 RepID=A0A7J6MJS5_PEROL|nr:Ca(2+)-dependent cysteine protease [Perkinsus olseni]
MSRPFTDDDIKAVRDLCPMGSDSDVELALWRANGDRNVAVNMLLSQQPRPAGSAPVLYPSRLQVAAPTVAAQSVPREQAERSADIRCCSCQEIMTVSVRGPRDESVEAEAACPRCHQMNRFVLPAEKEPVVASEAAPFKPYPQHMSANFEASDAAHAPPLTPQNAPSSSVMESQGQLGLPQNMRIQSVQVGTLVPTLTGVQRALLVGINYYGSNCELSGCIPDVHNMKRLLVETYHWNPNDIKLLTDDGQNEAPTRENIIRSMRWLVRDAKPGDIFFFHYSGHGAQQEDPLHLEEDGMNETIIPVDVQRSGQITDDVIHEILVDPLPSGARLTSVMDCCHSGTGMDLPFTWLAGRGWKEDVNPWHSRGDVQLFSGCDDSQTSADAAAGNLKGGAMTTAFCNAIRSNPQVSYTGLIEELDIEMKRTHMSQRPQLSTSQVFPVDRPFNLTDILPNQNQHIGRIVHKKFEARPSKQKNFALNALLAGGIGLAGGMLVGDAIGHAQDRRRRPIVVEPRRRPVVVEPRRRPVVVAPGRRPGPVVIEGPRGRFGGKGKGKGFRW